MVEGVAQAISHSSVVFLNIRLVIPGLELLPAMLTSLFVGCERTAPRRRKLLQESHGSPCHVNIQVCPCSK